MIDLTNCTLTSTSVFRDNRFTVEKNGKEYTCSCANPDLEWDRLYDHLGMTPISLDLVRTIEDEDETVYIVHIVR